MNYFNKNLFLIFILILSILSVLFTYYVRSSIITDRRILIPFYIYPNHWDDSYLWRKFSDSTKQTEIWVTINPDNGPGNSVNPDYDIGLSDINFNWIKIFCYIPTDYRKREINKVKEDIERYLKFYKKYNLYGIFFDEVNYSSKSILYYKEICNYAKIRGFKWIILNPGTSIDEEFLKEKVGDTIVIFEGSFNSFLKHKFPKYIGKYSKKRFAILVYDVKSLEDVRLVIDKSDKIGFIYCTDDCEPNPWDTLPSYWNYLIELFKLPKVRDNLFLFY